MNAFYTFLLLFALLGLIYLNTKYKEWSKKQDLAERLENVYIVPENPDPEFWNGCFFAIPDGVVFVVPIDKVNHYVSVFKDKIKDADNQFNVQVIGYIFRDATVNSNSLHQTWEEFKSETIQKIIINRSARHLALKRKSKKEYDFFLNNQT